MSLVGMGMCSFARNGMVREKIEILTWKTEIGRITCGKH